MNEFVAGGSCSVPPSCSSEVGFSCTDAEGPRMAWDEASLPSRDYSKAIATIAGYFGTAGNDLKGPQMTATHGKSGKPIYTYIYIFALST